MTKQRASLGFADSLDDFNLDEWAPKEKKADKAKDISSNGQEEDTKQLASEIASQAAKAAGFKSREPKKAAPIIKEEVALPRRRRTGRNAQFNLKARPETIAAFCAIADSQEWGLGETLEKAVALLEKEYKAK
ncbi:stability/partitioning determinant [Bartonella sp. HY761]|uniref:stability/partitioning determinant n=1 Tax=Bartonella sp. HY761 TaxID=2979330 RepID=UPI0021E24DAD|nr:stability/partitioning determinant [Bartonella sp. HY761]UXN08115.1 stability/partitioning determinant [Bartonella sp. HY761]UXN08119.1 stability/partitioning determinant [Bartonella sp. HY761]